MKLAWILTFCLSLSLSTLLFADDSPIHFISNIYEEGQIIQLDDGSLWAIGYWPTDVEYESAIVAEWQLGQTVEFFTRWNGLDKVCFFITNVENDTTVSAWLRNSSKDEFALQVDHIEANAITLTDGSSWLLKDYSFFNWNLSMSSKLFGNLIVVKKSGSDSYYLINTSSFEGNGYEALSL